MGKYQKSILNGIMVSLVFLLIILWASPWALCMTADNGDEIETIEMALIKDKGEYGILIDEREYRIIESTLIYDLMGKEIPLCDLPVPCQARVEYSINEELKPVCLRIEMRRLLEDSKDKG
jgi:hypothetical protein